MGLICQIFGHKYGADDICLRCGTSRGSEGLKFKRTADKQGYMLVSARECHDEVITVPQFYKRKRVKESEVTGVGDELIREVKETCNERLDFPDDFEERSLIFVGCPINDGNIENARKLKSGNYLTPEFIISLFYEKKNELYIMQRTVSLIKEGYSDVEKKLSYSDFDKCLVEIDTLKNGAKINFVRFYKDGAVFFETPLVDNDYYKEEYFNTVMHDKERFERS